MRRSGTDAYTERHATSAVARTTARRVARPAALWGLVFGATIAATMASYSSTFSTAASRADLVAVTEGNVAFSALFGPIHHIDTVAGYTAYKVSMTLIILGAIWGLLIATRVQRGEEDTGGWELLLSGLTTRARAAWQAALGLGVGLAVLWVPTAVLAMAAGRSSKVDIDASACVYFATAVVSVVAMFMAIGMFIGQLAASRHHANVIGAGVIAAAYLLRMVADSGSGLAWLRWASPLGWFEQLRPLTGSHPIAFLPILGLTAAFAAGSVVLAGRRDLGASAMRGRDRPRPRTALLGGQAGLTVRLTRPAVLGWLFALGATGLAMGLVTQSAGTALKGSPTLERVLGRLGGDRAGAVLYLGYVFVVAAGLVAIAVAGQISAIRNEEEAGRLDNMLVRPVARGQWLGVRVGVGLALVLLASALAGVAAWIGAVSQHSDVGFGELVRAGLNVAPPGVFVLGVGALAFGVVPRISIAFTYGVVIWSYLVEVLSAITDSNHWLRDTSPLLHIAPAPAAAPDWASASWLIGLGLVAALAGLAAFARRDLAGS
ncbi:MAG TPA: ABC transporter permease subunit [Jatrophihabitans sp.]|nr:ABC transporter permease subunit [Jatrophihabitans sp.]